jgi:hypothetical protein
MRLTLFIYNFTSSIYSNMESDEPYSNSICFDLISLIRFTIYNTSPPF